MLRPTFLISVLFSILIFATSSAYSESETLTLEQAQQELESGDALQEEQQSIEEVQAATTSEVPVEVEPVAPDYMSEPGLTGQREYKNDHLKEYIDPYTGNLHLDFVDLRLPGNGSMDIVLRRVYHHNRDDQYETPGDHLLGFGWTMHFGRVIRRTTNICRVTSAKNQGDENPVLELPDGSRLPFYPANNNYPGVTFLTKNWWRAECHQDSQGNNDGLTVYSPEGVQYTMNYRGYVEGYMNPEAGDL